MWVPFEVLPLHACNELVPPSRLPARRSVGLSEAQINLPKWRHSFQEAAPPFSRMHLWLVSIIQLSACATQADLPNGRKDGHPDRPTEVVCCLSVLDLYLFVFWCARRRREMDRYIDRQTERQTDRQKEFLSKEMQKL
mmetsp:Transcript_43933/g.86710  ORF Transcript_43933/g.86710 Transcript_43933/m.86710 type:complete len:138 (+) Transcript_43933:773-1186(+)